MARGKRRDPQREAFWRGVLGKFRSSGLSVRAFCRREDLSEPSFYAWRRVLRQRDAQTPPRREQRTRKPPQATPAFVPVVLRDVTANHPANHLDTGITVELRGGRVLHLPSTIPAERLGELIRAVESVETVA
jgi:transposase